MDKGASLRKKVAQCGGCLPELERRLSFGEHPIKPKAFLRATPLRVAGQALR